METTPALHDVIVVGGSFAGLSAALMLARARKRVLLVDAGKPRNRFAAEAHGVIGHDGTPPEVLLGNAVAQLMAYPTVTLKVATATGVSGHDGHFTLTLDGGERVEARKLVLATGVTDLLPDIRGMGERWGTGILHCPYCHGFEVAGRALGVLGTCAMSTHQALLIPEWGPTTYFTQGQFEPDDGERRLLQALGVAIETTPVVAVEGAGRTLERVLLADGRSVSIAAMFLAPAQKLASDLAVRLGCELDSGPLGPFVKVDGMKQTSVAGVFAAGDLAAPMQSAPMALAAGQMAGLAVHRALMEDDRRRLLSD
ncbi:NAD(P)/FAD-dependent oxidoreductase [Novilysobacter erysipheiresistens]